MVNFLLVYKYKIQDLIPLRMLFLFFIFNKLPGCFLFRLLSIGFGNVIMILLSAFFTISVTLFCVRMPNLLRVENCVVVLHKGVCSFEFKRFFDLEEKTSIQS